MSILDFAIFFICLYGVGYFVVKARWKLRYLVPIWFLSFFIITLFILAILFPKDWTNAQFFTKDGPNHLALFSLLISSSLSSLVTFILILVVWAIRHDVF
ncbi:MULTISPECIES: hypothetical protein [Acinetobacter]|uniref:Uncharacterized protein n=4 Tax=Acinetobacter nosocomialis TaxID=106654 RepID=A0AA36KCP9_ACINO|nr:MULTISPECIES: hypothetical protein [Acinetobacter]AZC04630.1 hypothetical protein DKE50_012420 [Acinetobacter nosocomialis]EKU6037334.1 hypothetical protein [Acinetobacter nosocomialis]ENV40077.1 hypothetical protein F958_03105 [Acinetobacter nosocomialis NIPH 386]EQN37100.1 hypothetical protein HMPREF0014_04522 [Acinetobacter sp. RUH 2624]KDM57104.1 hypothetical protein AE32_01359 [Acinetobacter nosocomialis]